MDDDEYCGFCYKTKPVNANEWWFSFSYGWACPKCQKTHNIRKMVISDLLFKKEIDWSVDDPDGADRWVALDIDGHIVAKAQTRVECEEISEQYLENGFWMEKE